MPRIGRVAPGEAFYHVINRANGRLRLFWKDADYQAFYNVLLQAFERTPTRILGWCLMSTHWHFVVWPREDGELSRFFGYLGLTHATRWQAAHNAVGTGHVYQARFKNFMIQPEGHLLQVLRYVERNPLRAKCVKRAEDWPWSSLHVRANGPEPLRNLLCDWPMSRPRNWVEQVNRPQNPKELAAISTALERGRPLGDESWVATTASRHGLQSTLRPRGRQPGWRKPPERE
jgi:REP-associated tyrosine transposase